MARRQVPLSAETERALAALKARRNDCIVSLSGYLEQIPVEFTYNLRA
jgi:hypothetical protein